jgi:hypothetical protein
LGTARAQDPLGTAAYVSSSGVLLIWVGGTVLDETGAFVIRFEAGDGGNDEESIDGSGVGEVELVVLLSENKDSDQYEEE